MHQSAGCDVLVESSRFSCAERYRLSVFGRTGRCVLQNRRHLGQRKRDNDRHLCHGFFAPGNLQAGSDRRVLMESKGFSRGCFFKSSVRGRPGHGILS